LQHPRVQPFNFKNAAYSWLDHLASGLIRLTITFSVRKKLANLINSLVHYAKGTLILKKLFSPFFRNNYLL